MTLAYSVCVIGRGIYLFTVRHELGEMCKKDFVNSSRGYDVLVWPPRTPALRHTDPYHLLSALRRQK